MVLQKKLPDDLEALVERAARKLLERDPQLGSCDIPYTAEEYDAMAREWSEFKRQVAPYEQTYADRGMLLSDIISEDRGE